MKLFQWLKLSTLLLICLGGLFLLFFNSWHTSRPALTEIHLGKYLSSLRQAANFLTERLHAGLDLHNHVANTTFLDTILDENPQMAIALLQVQGQDRLDFVTKTPLTAHEEDLPAFFSQAPNTEAEYSYKIDTNFIHIALLLPKTGSTQPVYLGASFTDTDISTSIKHFQKTTLSNFWISLACLVVLCVAGVLALEKTTGKLLAARVFYTDALRIIGLLISLAIIIFALIFGISSNGLTSQFQQEILRTREGNNKYYSELIARDLHRRLDYGLSLDDWQTIEGFFKTQLSTFPEIHTLGILSTDGEILNLRSNPAGQANFKVVDNHLYSNGNNGAVPIIRSADEEILLFVSSANPEHTIGTGLYNPVAMGAIIFILTSGLLIAFYFPRPSKYPKKPRLPTIEL